MIPQRTIEHKRDGGELHPDELEHFLLGYTSGAVGDDQMAAFLMAVYFNGLTAVELDTMVDVMLHSGRVLDLGHLPGPRVDKHSTGGVGDKVSIALAPLAAEMGLFVPMMSGRGLGHSGGTLDKLESIPGFRTRLPLDRFEVVLARVGCAMIGQTEEIAPLDRRLYALRDVTGTVPSRPLITASIMSKKLAEGLDGLVLDVKVGAGAFLPSRSQAEELAQAMVDVGAARGLTVRATLSAMDRPLGRAIGNALEVAEAIDCLRGDGPDDLRALTLHLAGEMACAGGLEATPEQGRAAAERVLEGGGALDRFVALVEAQGGDPRVVDGDALPRAAVLRDVEAPREGIVSSIEPRALGYGLIDLGGGRTRQDQSIDPAVGIVVGVAVGQRVEEGQPLATVHGADAASATAASKVVLDAIRITDADESDPLPTILGSVAGGGPQDTSSL